MLELYLAVSTPVILLTFLGSLTTVDVLIMISIVNSLVLVILTSFFVRTGKEKVIWDPYIHKYMPSSPLGSGYWVDLN